MKVPQPPKGALGWWEIAEMVEQYALDTRNIPWQANEHPLKKKARMHLIAASKCLYKLSDLLEKEEKP